jgi:NADH-quinone oxidoreductase subunit L
VFDWEDDFGGPLIRWIAILPFLSAITHGVLIGLIRAKLTDRSVWAISLSAVSIAFLISAISIFDLVSRGGFEPILDTVGPWLGGGVGQRSFSAELTLQFDPLSAVFCVTITSVAIAVYLHTIGSILHGSIERRDGHRAFAMLDLLVGSTLVLVLADNLLLFFLGWAGVGIASHLFSSFDYADREAGRAGATTFVIGRIGDLGLLGAMLLLFDGLSRAGAPALTFRGIEAAFRLLEGQYVPWLSWGALEAPLLLEVVGFGLVLAALTKCAQLPLHFWLSSATSGPVAANALIQSATTVVAGVYVLLRFAFLLENAPDAMGLLVVAGSATMLLASLASATQLHLPRLVAFTTSSLLGFVILGIGIGAPSTATFLLLTHAFVKAHLVLAVGIVLATHKGETDLRRMGGLAQRMGWTQWIFGLGCVALVGIPPFANFFPFEELLAFLWISDRPESGLVLGIALVSIGLLAFGVGRAFFLIFWGNVRPGGLVEPQLRDPTGLRQYSLSGLAVMTVAAGFLTPSQFWAELFGMSAATKLDSIGHFLSASIPGSPDPELAGSERAGLIAAMLFFSVGGLVIAALRYARRGYRGESKQRAIRISIESMREMLYIEKFYDVGIVRPLRWLSQVAVVGGIENQLINRVVVSGGSGLFRRIVWGVLRRLQNGRLQSYALLGLLTVLVVVTWMVAGGGI